jgi:hypothetical protein
MRIRATTKLRNETMLAGRIRLGPEHLRRWIQQEK